MGRMNILFVLILRLPFESMCPVMSQGSFRQVIINAAPKFALFGQKQIRYFIQRVFPMKKPWEKLTQFLYF